MLLRSVLCCLLAAAPLLAQSPSTDLRVVQPETNRHFSKVWLTSALLLVAASSLDASSSWGKYEGNPLLRSSDGRFGARGVSIKLGLAGAWLAPQILLRKNHTATRLFTITNFAQAAVYTGIAVHNYDIPSPKPGQPAY